MKKIIRLIAFTALLLTAAAPVDAQENQIETMLSGDIVSSYIWRGQDLGSAALQPTFGIAYKGLSLSAWGSYGFADPQDTKEMDLTLSYTGAAMDSPTRRTPRKWI